MRNTILILSIALLFFLPQPVSQEQTDYGTMTEAERGVFDGILSAVDAGQAVVRCEGIVNHDRVRTHLGLYYGTVKGLGRLYTVVNGDIHLNLNAFPAFEQNRLMVNAKVDKALPHIRQGTDRYKLKKIAKYIADNYCYIDGEFVCADYAILFYKIASRLGIQTYLCFGYSCDELHAWNYAGGRFYDVTWYDSTGNREYIGSKNEWGRQSVKNDAYACLK